MPTILEHVQSYFGIELKRDDDVKKLPTFAPKIEDDGAVLVSSASNYGTFVDFDGTIRSEAELINKYRDMSLHPEIDDAIDNIVNEGIVTEEGEKTVQIVLDDLGEDFPEDIKAMIEDEFEECLRLLEFHTKSYDVFRRWYIDGRLYYEVVVDPQNLHEGVKELRYLDPRKIRKIREVAKRRDPTMPAVTVPKTVKEYYLYSEKSLAQSSRQLVPTGGGATTALKIAKDSVIHCTSGLTDVNQTQILSHLHKAIRGLNQLRAMEDAVVIYRISRAPERRVFYIDVGSLPKHKAEQHLKDMMVKHRNKLVYDISTGEVRDDRKFMTMLEDFWLARREGGKSTEITTLPGGQNLGQMEDVDYFRRKLYKSMNVPFGRLDPEAMFTSGRSSEISRDEVKFSKFVDRLRLKFSSLFLQILEKNLVLKEIVSPDEWDNISTEIRFRFLRDNDFSEMKEGEILTQRFMLLEQASLYAGKYYSHEWIRKEILKQTDEEIEEQDALISEEAANPQFMQMGPPMPDMGMGPAGPDMGGMPPEMGGGMPPGMPGQPPPMDAGPPTFPYDPSGSGGQPAPQGPKSKGATTQKKPIAKGKPKPPGGKKK